MIRLSRRRDAAAHRRARCRAARRAPAGRAGAAWPLDLPDAPRIGPACATRRSGFPRGGPASRCSRCIRGAGDPCRRETALTRSSRRIENYLGFPAGSRFGADQPRSHSGRQVELRPAPRRRTAVSLEPRDGRLPGAPGGRSRDRGAHGAARDRRAAQRRLPIEGLSDHEGLEPRGRPRRRRTLAPRGLAWSVEATRPARPRRLARAACS